MKGTTTGEDFIIIFEETLEKYDLQWDKIVTIATDVTGLMNKELDISFLLSLLISRLAICLCSPQEYPVVYYRKSFVSD